MDRMTDAEMGDVGGGLVAPLIPVAWMLSWIRKEN